MPWRSLFLCCMLPLILHVADVPRLNPLLQRVELEPTATAEVVFTLRGPVGTTIILVLVDCACLKITTLLLPTIGADGIVPLTFRASGVRPWVEEIRVVTSGSLRHRSARRPWPAACHACPITQALTGMPQQEDA